MTRQMSAGSQIAFTNAWLESKGIEAQTVDVRAHIDPSLSYEENIKLLKRRLGMGGRSTQKATRTMSASECDVAIGNYEAGMNHGSMADACECGHPDACDDIEVKAAKAKPKKIVKPKAKPKAKPTVTRRKTITKPKTAAKTLKGTKLTKVQRKHLKDYDYVNITHNKKKIRITPSRVKRGIIQR